MCRGHARKSEVKAGSDLHDIEKPRMARGSEVLRRRLRTAEILGGRCHWLFGSLKTPGPVSVTFGAGGCTLNVFGIFFVLNFEKPYMK